MQGLMLKLLNVDAEGERALRVVSYFDQLMLHHPDLESVVRSTAILADCTAGIRLPGNGGTHRINSDGVSLPAAAAFSASSSVTVPIDEDNAGAGFAWLERDGSDGDLDEFILERMALIAASVIQRSAGGRDIDFASGFSDPALVQLLVNDRASEAERSRAARLMGLDHSSPIQIVAWAPEPGTSSDLEASVGTLRELWKRQIHLAQLSTDLAIAIVVTREKVDWSEVLIGGRASSGTIVEAVNAPKSWRQAREGLRFAGIGTAWPRLLDSDVVGSLRLLSILDAAEVNADKDVERIQALWDSPGGTESIQILDYFLHAESVRSAAREAKFHHSSIQNRLGRIETAIAISLKTGDGRQRAAHALLLWQLFRER
jgi:hypothetical protein